jgi:endonuclease/exonuclease/phosphatase family metal-dependent hydrolase
VHGEFSPFGYGGHPRSRTAHAARLFDYAAGRTVTIAHMHGLRDLDGKRDTPARLRQAERFLALVEATAAPGDGIVLCGDFNVLPGSRTFGILSAAAATELVTAGGFPGTRTSWYAKTPRFADYMLVNDAVRVKAFTVVTEPEVSDHCPLLLEIG